MNHIYIAISLFILLSVCLIIYTYYKQKRRHKRRHKKESFVELSDIEVEKLRNERGLEKCKPLLVNKEDISDDNFLTMTQYIDGLRIRKWKPNKDEESKADPSKEYCYMYNDTVNKTQDYILENNPENTFNSCSSSNPLFNSDLVTNVFESEYTDKSHNVPIKKCIFEMDKDKLKDSAELSNFWGNFRQNDCFMLGQNIRNDLREKEETYNGLILNKETKFGEMISQSNDLILKNNDLSNCTSELNSINREYDDINEKLEVCKAKNTPLENRIRQLQQDISNLEYEIAQLETEKQNFMDLYSDSLQKYEVCHKSDHPECKRLSQLLEGQIEYYKDEIKKFEDRNIKLRELIAEKEKEFREKSDEYTKCTTNLNNLELLLETKREEYSLLVDSNVECTSNLNYYIDGYNQFKNDYNESSNVFFECENEKGILENRLESCRDTVGSCINYISYLSEKHWDAEINEKKDVDNFVPEINFSDLSPHFDGISDKVDTLKSKTGEYKDKFNECTKENAKLITDIETLNERKNTLRTNLQDVEDRGKDTSSQSLKSIVSNAKNMNDQIIPEYISLFKDFNLKNKCVLNDPDVETEYNSVVKENERLKNDLSALTSSEQTCNTDCDITLPQCLIHKNHEQICGGVALQMNADDPRMISATVEFYDQTNDKVQTLEITEPNEEYKVTISGSTELKYFVFKNNNPAADITFSYKATTGSIGDQDSLCDETNWNKKPYSIGNIERSTTYLKVILFRGITCVKIASNDLRISEPEPEPEPEPAQEPLRNGSADNDINNYECGEIEREYKRRGGFWSYCKTYKNKITGKELHYSEYADKFNINYDPERPWIAFRA